MQIVQIRENRPRDCCVSLLYAHALFDKLRIVSYGTCCERLRDRRYMIPYFSRYRLKKSKSRGRRIIGSASWNVRRNKCAWSLLCAVMAISMSGDTVVKYVRTSRIDFYCHCCNDLPRSFSILSWVMSEKILSDYMYYAWIHYILLREIQSRDNSVKWAPCDRSIARVPNIFHRLITCMN